MLNQRLRQSSIGFGMDNPAFTTRTSNGSSTAQVNKEDQTKEKYLNYHGHGEYYPKPLVLFSIDISHWSPTLQSFVLIGGLIFFMCIYGYYQELVIYGWFDRKLSIFSTFLHFLGCSIFAQIQRHVSHTVNSRNFPPGSSQGSSTASCQQFAMSMGTAPPRIAVGYYLLLVLTKTIAQGMSNLSMTQINYPAKVLFKSANPIVTMIIGACWLKKSYPWRDYVVVILLVLGLYVFITGDLQNAPHSTGWGIFYVVLSMFGSAGVPMIQEHCISTYHATVEDLLYYSYIGSTLISLILAVCSGEFGMGISFLMNSGSVHTWFIFFAFCSFSFLGANFSTAITAQYGALVNGIANTFRKAATIAMSFLLFPERNEITNHKIFGALIFFSGLLVRIFVSHRKDRPPHNGTPHSPKKERMVECLTNAVTPPTNQMYINANAQMLALSESTQNLLDIESACPNSIHTEDMRSDVEEMDLDIEDELEESAVMLNTRT